MTTHRLTSKFISISTLLLTVGIVTPTISLFPSLAQPAVAQSAESMASRVYQQASPAVVTIKNGSGHGSGFIVSADGWIITNAHVVADSPRIVTVRLNDGRQVPADVIGFAHNGVDLAALKIYGATNLPSLPLAPADSIQVGQNIFVIGTPLSEEYQNTLSRGIISRFSRRDGVIQHDANTNAGNSGAPFSTARARLSASILVGMLATWCMATRVSPLVLPRVASTLRLLAIACNASSKLSKQVAPLEYRLYPLCNSSEQFLFLPLPLREPFSEGFWKRRTFN